MLINKTVLAIGCALIIGLGGCSRQQSEWQKTREANSPEAYEQFLKKYPSGEFSAQAQARLKEMNEERDWQKARDADTPEAYQAFLKQYPEGKWTEEARIRVENFTLAQTPAGAVPGAAGGTGAAGGAAAPPAASEPGDAQPGASAQPGAGGEAAQESAPSAPPRAPAAAAVHATPRHAAAAAAGVSAPHAGGESKHGQYAVQLGAFKSGREAAHKRWRSLQKQYPALFADVSSRVVARKSAGTTLYRLQAVGLGESQAKKICKALKAKGQPCVLVRP